MLHIVSPPARRAFDELQPVGARALVGVEHHQFVVARQLRQKRVHLQLPEPAAEHLVRLGVERSRNRPDVELRDCSLRFPGRTEQRFAVQKNG
ncbi:hypothetical protein VA596_28675 [Amycolatopsis sp., V23-08]|uniref:Uncharacterized protein n=1 Tax=Amycolatopsis heterodermiae TaxID=3110235 RepID=A0ABU5RBA7_9PSEU|nr:hypothetical protein [Amycolatopsis sp., V23-08]MEA5363537.1 hypothetical protein [Amycolatopsis sp., V23-08]